MRDAAGNVRNVTRTNGRYSKQLLCYGCNKPAGSDPYCDHDTGHVLCQRKACLKRLDTMSMADRTAHYEAMRAKRTEGA